MKHQRVAMRDLKKDIEFHPDNDDPLEHLKVLASVRLPSS